jgi:hypothetical protein
MSPMTYQAGDFVTFEGEKPVGDVHPGLLGTVVSVSIQTRSYRVGFATDKGHRLLLANEDMLNPGTQSVFDRIAAEGLYAAGRQVRMKRSYVFKGDIEVPKGATGVIQRVSKDGSHVRVAFTLPGAYQSPEVTAIISQLALIPVESPA